MENAEPYSKYCGATVVKASASSAFSGAATTESNSNSVANWIRKIFKKSKPSSIAEEIKIYLSDSDAFEDKNLIVYWEENKGRFLCSCLIQMAKTYLSVAANSTPSERCFSDSHLLCHNTRGSLSPEKLSALNCLNNWLENGYKVGPLINE